MARLRRLSARDLAAAVTQKRLARAEWLRGGQVRSHRVGDAVAGARNNVHAIGVGRKLVGGKPTDSACIRFYVTRKMPRSLLSSGTIIPGHINGVPTDVIESRRAYLANAQPPPLCSLDKLRRQRPVSPGISAANESLLAGTIAAICRSLAPGEEQSQYVLGCRHVFQDLSGTGAPLERILQPSRVDGGVEADAIAVFARAIPIDAGPSAGNQVDAAIARLVDGVDATVKICHVGTLTGTAAPVHGAVVHKHGRTSGYTVGVIDDPSIDVLVPESEISNAPLAHFISQFRVLPATGVSLFAQSGDSGSLIVNRSDQAAVGLLFACPRDNTFAYASPIEAALNALQIRLDM